MIRYISYFLLLDVILGANILGFFPFPSKSHHNVFRPIMEGLANKGHQITFVAPISFKKPNPNIKQIIIPNYMMEIMKTFQIDLNEFGSYSIPHTTIIMYQFGLALGELTYSLREVQALIHSNEKFDVVITESFFIQEASSAFAHKFNAIPIDIMSFGDSAWVNEFAGIPDNPSYMIDSKAHYSDKMNFFEKLKNTYVQWASTAVGYYYMPRMQELVDKYFNYTGSETRPYITKLQSDKALILVNSHHSVGYAYPKAPHVKEIGGIHIVEDKPLPKDLQKFLDDAKNGVVYVSMGSNLNISAPESVPVRDAFVKTFKNLKQQVLFKFESDILPEVSPNVKMSKWFPQQDILGLGKVRCNGGPYRISKAYPRFQREVVGGAKIGGRLCVRGRSVSQELMRFPAHKNLKVFVSHGGFLSISESINNGVPIVGIPFFADQPKNLKQVTSAGYGVEITLDNLTEISLTWAVNEVVNNPSYAKEAKRRSLLFRDRPMKPRDEAVYWIEYVIKHGKALQPRSIHLSFFQLHNLDIIGFLILVSYIMYYLLCKLICSKRTTNITPQKKKN